MEDKLLQLQKVIGGGTKKSSSKSNKASSDVMMDDAAIMKLLEGDFDPDQFEQLMRETYNDSDFYNQQDPEWKNDKDVIKSRREVDVELLGGAVEAVEEDEEEDGDDDRGDDDADDGGGEAYKAGDDDEEMWPDEEPPPDDDGEQVEEEETELVQKVRAKMQDELYKLDYEDIVAGMPTRFKYRQVEPNRYGLTTEEILLARDGTLKQYVSLKKMVPYGTGSEYRVHAAKRRKFRELLQQDIAEQRQELEDAQPKEVMKKKKRRLRKKERRTGGGYNTDMTTSLAAAENDNDDANVDMADVDDEQKKTAHSEEDEKEAAAKKRATKAAEKRLKKKQNAQTNVAEKVDVSIGNFDTKKPPPAAALTNDVDEIEQETDPKPVTKASSPATTESKQHKKVKNKKNKKRKRKHKVEGVSEARMEAYGL
jgi:protein KRI1